jgi:hypothetical protein
MAAARHGGGGKGRCSTGWLLFFISADFSSHLLSFALFSFLFWTEHGERGNMVSWSSPMKEWVQKIDPWLPLINLQFFFSAIW